MRAISSSALLLNARCQIQSPIVGAVATVSVGVVNNRICKIKAPYDRVRLAIPAGDALSTLLYPEHIVTEDRGSSHCLAKALKFNIQNTNSHQNLMLFTLNTSMTVSIILSCEAAQFGDVLDR